MSEQAKLATTVSRCMSLNGLVCPAFATKASHTVQESAVISCVLDTATLDVSFFL